MKLKESIQIVKNGGVFGKTREARLSIHRAESFSGPQSDNELKTELCRDIMSELGLTEKEMIELEHRNASKK